MKEKTKIAVLSSKLDENSLVVCTIYFRTEEVLIYVQRWIGVIDVEDVVSQDFLMVAAAPQWGRSGGGEEEQDNNVT